MRIRPHPWHTIRINKMLSCAGADRLQQGMRQAYGKPYAKAARVEIGDALISIRTRPENVKGKSPKPSAWVSLPMTPCGPIKTSR